LMEGINSKNAFEQSSLVYTVTNQILTLLYV
jgi:hypothetical protein